MITIHHWNPAEKTRTISPDELLSQRDRLLTAESVLWIDLCGPSDDEERLVLEQFFPVHKLTHEDITRLKREPDAPPHHPKVEEFPDYLFIIVNPLTDRFQKAAENPEAAVNHVAPLTQLSAVLTHQMLITYHAVPLMCIDVVRGFLGRHEAQQERGPDYLFHLILDSTVDEFVPVLDFIEDSLENLETRIIHHPKQTLFVRLLHIKREIILLRKTLISEREVLVRLARGEFSLVDPRETIYYRNVYDHLVRFTELIETSREMASDLMQTYLSAQSNHLNQIMKVLTMISTIVLPMTLISGIYGMNFNLLVPASDHAAGFFIALGLMLVSGVFSLALFWWRRWL